MSNLPARLHDVSFTKASVIIGAFVTILTAISLIRKIASNK